MTTGLSASSIPLLHRGQQDLHFQPSEGLFTGPEPRPAMEAAVRLRIQGGGLDGTRLRLQYTDEETEAQREAGLAPGLLASQW